MAQLDRLQMKEVIKTFEQNPDSPEAISTIRELIHLPEFQKELTDGWPGGTVYAPETVEKIDKQFGFNGVLVKAQKVKAQLLKFMEKPRSKYSKEMGAQLFNDTKEIISNPIGHEIITATLQNDLFHSIVELFDLPSELLEKRKQLDQEIIFNPKGKDFQMVQNAMADLLFHSGVHNGVIKIQTIRDMVRFRPEFQKVLDTFSEIFDEFEKFALMTKDTPEEEFYAEITKLCNIHKSYFDKGIVVGEEVKRILKEAEQLQEAEIKCGCIEGANKILKGLSCKDVENSDGEKTRFYKIAKQTTNQEEFFLLVRTIFLRSEEFPNYSMDDYLEVTKNRHMDCGCFSIINQSASQIFGKKECDVCLVYGDIDDDCELLNSTTSDGSTFSYPFFSKDIHVRKQDYYSLQDLMQESSMHTEIAFSNASKIKPKFILSKQDPPSELLIKRASQLGLPIIFIDPTAYKQHDYALKTQSASQRCYSDYKYGSRFLDKPLMEIDYYENEKFLV